MPKRKSLLIVLAAAICGHADNTSETLTELLAIERQAMDGWLNGDPAPQLAACDPEITFFHAVTEKRVEGLAALKELYERYRGVPLFDSYEILNPAVQVSGNVAILTYQLVQHNSGRASNWNGTQVYRRGKDGWRVIHTHWSEVRLPR